MSFAFTANHEQQTTNTHTHTHTPLQHLWKAALLVAGMAVINCPQRASAADCQEYRLTPIKQIGFVPNVVPIQGEGHGTMGINNKGQACYGYKVNPANSNDPIRAWVWLPTADVEYNFAAGFHDIHDLSGLPSQGVSIARDINIHGRIIGRTGEVGAGMAAMWTINDNDADHVSLSAALSTAHAISDDETGARIVGHNLDKDLFGCGFEVVEMGTLWVLGGDAEVLEPVRGYPHGQSVAFDVGPLSSETIVGESHICVLDQPCSTTAHGTTWGPPDMISIGSVKATEFSVSPIPYGTDDNGRISGFARYQEFQFGPCHETAAFWINKAADPIDLGLYMPAGQQDQQCRALAINLMEDAQVVGSNRFLSRAVLWQATSTSWDSWDLNGCIGDYYLDWTIREAHDINDDGWIIAYAEKEVPVLPEGTTIEHWAVILSPLVTTCPQDLNGDGTVGTPDLLIVINGWGPCQVGVVCVADINRDPELDLMPDGTVGTPDLLAVINAWGPCPGGESMMGGPEPPAWLDDVAAILQDTELSESEQLELIQEILAEQAEE